jgi:Protein kinase domain
VCLHGHLLNRLSALSRQPSDRNALFILLALKVEAQDGPFIFEVQVYLDELDPHAVKHERAVLAPIGTGGMGEVYKARDTKLDRDVAIKVLPQALAQDPERLARFEREAKVLAALNHPNIAQIYGLEQRALGHCQVNRNPATFATKSAGARTRNQ